MTSPHFAHEGSLRALKDAGYSIEPTKTLMNCPIVPAGSIATHRLSGNDTGLHMDWYRNKVVSYFNFIEAPLMAVAKGIATVNCPVYSIAPEAGRDRCASAHPALRRSK